MWLKKSGKGRGRNGEMEGGTPETNRRRMWSIMRRERSRGSD
jgi:hypothetical protein